MVAYPHSNTDSSKKEDVPSIQITQADFDNGLSREQLDWLLSHLNLAALRRALDRTPSAAVQEGGEHGNAVNP